MEIPSNRKLALTLGIGVAILATCAGLLRCCAPQPHPDGGPPPQAVPLGAHFRNPVNITEASSVTTPALTFEGDTDTGFWRPTTDTLAVAIAGAEEIRLDATALTVSNPLVVTGACDLQGNLSDSGGDLTIADAIAVTDGNALSIDQVNARDGDGLALYDDASAGIFVEDGGDVGIGTTSPSTILEISGTAPAITIGDGAQETATIKEWTGGGGAGKLEISTHVSATSGHIAFSPNGSEAARIQENGNVGIGTTTPSGKLTVDNVANGSGVLISGDNARNDALLTLQGTGTAGGGAGTQRGLLIDYTPGYNVGRLLDVQTSSTSRFLVDTSGNVGIGTDDPSNNLEVIGGATISSTGAANIELRSSGGSTPYFDLSNDTASDYDARLILSGDDTLGVSGANLDIEEDRWVGADSDCAWLFDASNSDATIQDDVGIGTTNPDRQLIVHDSGETTEARVSVASNNQVGLGVLRNQSGGSYNNTWLIYMAASSKDLRWYNTDAASVVLAMEPDGDLGLGVNTPGYDLEIDGDAGKPGGGSWSNSSDRRLKKNIRPLEGRHALDLLAQLQPVSFEWISPTKQMRPGTHAGLVAQDLQQVFPSWVHTATVTGTQAALLGQSEALATYYPHDFNAYLIQAIQELDRQNQALQATVNAQAAAIAQLEKRIAALEKHSPGPQP